MAIRSLDTGQQNTLTQGSYPRVTATDELISLVPVGLLMSELIPV